MVKAWLFVLILWWMQALQAASPLVEASLDSYNNQAHFPLEGTLTITHDKQEEVDLHSIQMEGKPLDAVFVRHVPMPANANVQVSIYHFQLPARDKGLYLLPSISVKVGGKVYESLPTAYEVKGPTSKDVQPSISQNPTSSHTIFRLDAQVNGPTHLYPGQRTKLFYRISFNRSIDLTHSELPFIHPPHFQKIGDVKVEDRQDPTVTVQELTQEIKAAEIGTFHLGPSSIEGYAYTLKNGQKDYDPQLLRAKAPSITLTVSPFPKQKQPPSFNGALGNIRAEAQLLSADHMTVGDNVQVQIQVRGIDNLLDLTLPLLVCQPGFSGFFQMSDLPPLSEVEGRLKVFTLNLRPLTTWVTQIPPIELSSFDPATEKYIVQTTPALPLKVVAHRSNKKQREQNALPLAIPQVPLNWPVPPLVPLAFQGQMPTMQSPLKWQQTPWVLILLPLLGLLLLLQHMLSQWWQKHQTRVVPASEKFFQRALKGRLKSRKSLQHLELAFWKRLLEKRLITTERQAVESLPQEGKLGSIRTFLGQLQALQYSPHKEYDRKRLQRQAQELFQSI